jgi:hypothetical protein
MRDAIYLMPDGNEDEIEDQDTGGELPVEDEEV